MNLSKSMLTAIGILLLVISVFAVTSIIVNFYVAAALVVLLIIGIVYAGNRISYDLKKKISDNLFMIITGSLAILLIVFVIYILTYIFWQAKSHLTWEFIFSEPKEGLSEGGIFPAIVGTALLVIIMAVVGVPFGTLTAIYLTEYAKETSKIARIIRFAINTLSGVPAIVFGLFGLGFFIGTIGESIDTYNHNNKMGKFKTILEIPSGGFVKNDKVKLIELSEYLKKDDYAYWKEQLDQLELMTNSFGKDYAITKKEILKSFDDNARPQWGQPALIWAALTMALLTLPVVIVSVEEALRAVPKSLREASLALGATKLTTLIRVVIPSSITGILTGTILAVSRGAGEVAPILFTGAAYFLPDLPSGLNSQFMELGYHIYILTTQSTDVEATLPLQYATTFVLLMLTFALNFTAIFIRSSMRKKFGKMS
jgi:ABC-type phosphate transport system permease subunit